ncbi:hypothetical protein ACFL14_01530 [Patescibacteria group bacterium]
MIKSVIQNKPKFFLILTLILIGILILFGLGYFLWHRGYFDSGKDGARKVKCDALHFNDTWEGEIYVDCNLVIPKGVTLTIKPGTVVKFRYDRDYKTFHRGGLYVDGGTVKAIGEADKQIWFTSAAKEPINGDWNGININNSSDSEFKYVIVEYGEMGIEQFDSKVPVTKSIIRWSNAEGLYAERSEPYFDYNTLYGNGYHDIALEQYNKNV